ncbi:hypothetical protein Psuf_079960 [Phytohabitans suffuscus]|uniref:MalT-like TPR region domain-containing protein n=1 Tax=Phytohabitans suffuscus TaxID=624315 RepID=A0A6F8YXF6_9ACTN|nr:hypothetical protein Psuf_079960 [Phytohabitans suffuscus]
MGQFSVDTLEIVSRLRASDVDPAKFDFYTMDCYRSVGANKFARTYATEVIRASADASGVERKPMRIAEAHITLAVIDAREGDLGAAVRHGETAISAERKSLPSLLFAEKEFSSLLTKKYNREPLARSYLEAVRSIATTRPANT